MDYRKYVADLERKCDVFLSQVATLGNECAWTDRAVEAILVSAAALRKKYYGKATGLRRDISNIALHGVPDNNGYKARVEVLKGACAVFRGRVKACGNECAYTDAALEMALDAATVLDVAYYGPILPSREGASIEAQIQAATAVKEATDKATVSPKTLEKGAPDYVL